MKFVSVFPDQVIIDVQKSCFLKTVQVPVASIRSMRTDLEQADAAVIGAVAPHDVGSVITIAAATIQKTHLWIEILANLDEIGA